MVTSSATKDRILQIIDSLPPEQLPELQQFAEYLAFKTGIAATQAEAGQGTMARANIKSVLDNSAGLWLERKEDPVDGVEWVNTARQSTRLTMFIDERDEDSRH